MQPLFVVIWKSGIMSRDLSHIAERGWSCDMLSESFLTSFCLRKNCSLKKLSIILCRLFMNGSRRGVHMPPISSLFGPAFCLEVFYRNSFSFFLSCSFLLSFSFLLLTLIVSLKFIQSLYLKLLQELTLIGFFWHPNLINYMLYLWGNWMLFPILGDVRKEKVIEALSTSGLVQPAGIAISLRNTGQQW